MTDEALIETVARAMCIADGLDPDEQTSGGPNDFAKTRADFCGYAVCKYGKAWEQYRRQANLLIAGQKALAESQRLNLE